MFYVIRVKGWPVLVWLENAPPAERYEVLATADDILNAAASFHDAVVELVRARRAARARASPAEPESESWSSWPG